MTTQDLRARGLVHKVQESDRYSTQYADIGIVFAGFNRLGHPLVAIVGSQAHGIDDSCVSGCNCHRQSYVPFSS